ncbi:MAG: dihydroneopterin aldolase [Ardenticatenales bacterium]|nr:dihydroneopterin aldolase [Ardenticatenales bacterium]
MDKIIIRNLEFYSFIGVTKAEQEVGQRLVVNLEIGYDLAPAGHSDALGDTLSYTEIAQTVLAVGTSLECRLLEVMAEQMVYAIFEHFPTHEVRLQLLKKPPPTTMMMEAAGVEILRQRRGGQVE